MARQPTMAVNAQVLLTMLLTRDIEFMRACPHCLSLWEAAVVALGPVNVSGGCGNGTRVLVGRCCLFLVHNVLVHMLRTWYLTMDCLGIGAVFHHYLDGPTGAEPKVYKANNFGFATARKGPNPSVLRGSTRTGGYIGAMNPHCVLI